MSLIMGQQGPDHPGNHSVSAPLNIGVADPTNSLRELLAGYHTAPESRSDRGNFHPRSRMGVSHGKMGRYWKV